MSLRVQGREAARRATRAIAVVSVVATGVGGASTFFAVEAAKASAAVAPSPGQRGDDDSGPRLGSAPGGSLSAPVAPGSGASQTRSSGS